jgi:NAD(P)-dependent dehydrogenase (short-subunit alcohol dehydrogenase family)
MELMGKVAIVTGSATGIGAATAQMLAAKGCNVVVNYRQSADAAEETAGVCQGLGVETLLLQGDVADDADCRRMVAEAAERWGRVDVLVNNAGTTKRVAHTDLEGLSAEDFQRLYAVNTIGPFQMTRAAVPHMREAGDSAVVNISAGAAFHGGAASIAYAASKGALNTMTKSLARALAPEIRVNAICPGFVQSPWLGKLVGQEAYEKRLAAAEATFPLGRANRPEHIADAALWLIERAETMTGELINMDAGEHLL